MRGAARPRRLAPLAAALLLGACTAVGPNYSGPPLSDFAPTPAAYKHAGPPATSNRFADARPADKEPRGPWWRLFRDGELDRLENLALSANQDLRVAAARIAESRAQSRVAAADFYPNAQFDGSAQRQRTSDREPFTRGQLIGQNPFAGAAGGTAGGTTGGGTSGGAISLAQQPRTTTQNLFRAPVDLNWELDLFGRVRRNYEAARADRQAIEADFNNMALSVTANVAVNYFVLRAYDAEIGVLTRTIATRREAVQIAQERLEAGLTGELDVSRARSDLATNEADLFGVRRTRGETENAIATLLGQPASTLRLGYRPTPERGAPPRVPAGLPSRMLERRPDVAEAERNLAAANARIGVAVAAFFPIIKLTGAAGFESADIGSLFVWPARFWQIGPSITLPIFEGGRNLANLRVAQARYEESVGRYRGQVLTAFQEVENALVDLRNLAGQAEAQGRAVAAARRSLELAQNSNRQGATNFLDVLDAQRTLLQSERTSAQLLGQRLQATVNLVKALGGDWD